ncbi:MAG: hypothetical protein H6R33_606 [Actinobacteria bacterium]|nr:hypothetical protein [Actinomycetota bacterium]
MTNTTLIRPGSSARIPTAIGASSSSTCEAALASTKPVRKRPAPSDCRARPGSPTRRKGSQARTTKGARARAHPTLGPVAAHCRKAMASSTRTVATTPLTSP